MELQPQFAALEEEVSRLQTKIDFLQNQNRGITFIEPSSSLRQMVEAAKQTFEKDWERREGEFQRLLREGELIREVQQCTERLLSFRIASRDDMNEAKAFLESVENSRLLEFRRQSLSNSRDFQSHLILLEQKLEQTKVEITKFEVEQQLPPPRPPPPSAICPSFSVDLVDLVPTEGQRCELRARLNGGEPLPKVTWFKAGHPATNHESHFDPDNGWAILSIAKTAMSDSGNWSVRASNMAGYAESHAKLTVRPAGKPSQIPKFVEPLSNQTVLVGEKLLLRCRLQPGHPPPALTWMHDGRELHEHTHYDTATQILTLFIEETSVASAGLYTCNASNAAGVATSTAKIKIEVPSKPSFYVPLKNIECSEGDTVVLEVVIISTPSPEEIRWYHNDLPCDAINQMKKQGDVFQLILRDVQKTRHEGDYKVLASNLAGFSMSSCSLKIRETTRVNSNGSGTNVGMFVSQLTQLLTCY